MLQPHPEHPTQDFITFQRPAFVVNPRSGGVGENALEDIGAICAAAGFACTAIVLDDDGIDAALAELPADADAVFVLGGDGTARTVAQRLGPNGPPFAPLPGGTMNLLPKAIYGDRRWRDILPGLLASGVKSPLPGGFANGDLFLLAGVFGAPALVAPAREALRRGSVIEAVQRFRYAAARAFGAKVRARPFGHTAKRGEAIALLAPNMAGVTAPLEWAVVDPKGALDAARIGFAVLSGADWRADPAALTTHAASGRITARGPIPAILDGEPVMFARDVQITYAARAANVVREAKADGPVSREEAAA